MGWGPPSQVGQAKMTAAGKKTRFAETQKPSDLNLNLYLLLYLPLPSISFIKIKDGPRDPREAGGWDDDAMHCWPG
jgi:hypothetical protein